MRATFFAPFFLIAAVTLAGCGSGDAPTIGGAARHADQHGESSPVAHGAREIAVTATSFEFVPAEIVAAVGEDLAIVLTSEDMEHDFVIDEFGAHIVADGGETETGGFTAAQAGRFTYYCAVPGHREAGMAGVLVVE